MSQETNCWDRIEERLASPFALRPPGETRRGGTISRFRLTGERESLGTSQEISMFVVDAIWGPE